MIMSGRTLMSVALIGGVFFVPSLLMVLLGASSFSAGLLLVCFVFVFFLYYWREEAGSL